MLTPVGDVHDLLTLPTIGEPPWWLTRGDRPCWYTLRVLLERTAAVASADK
jgi:hypothetical protein